MFVCCFYVFWNGWVLGLQHIESDIDWTYRAYTMCDKCQVLVTLIAVEHVYAVLTTNIAEGIVQNWHSGKRPQTRI